MWDLPRPGLEPVAPALAGGFLTTAPPGKSLGLSFYSYVTIFGQQMLVEWVNAIQFLPSFLYPNNGTRISKPLEASLLPNSERTCHAEPFGFWLVSPL